MAPAKIDEMKVKHSVRSAAPFKIKSYTLPHEVEESIETVLGIYLEEMGQSELKTSLGYCLRELAVNAKKANTKRIYFQEKDLDINNPQDYEKGMETFREETVAKIKYYMIKQEKAGLYVEIVFQPKGENLTISVHNNVEISKKEQIRVYDRIARSRACSSMEEALSCFLDDSEGAGLGIVILVMALKNIGLTEDSFDIDVVNGETVAKLIVPFSKMYKEHIASLSREIVNRVDTLPHFPPTIVALQELVDDPDSEMTDIANKIGMDPSLTADLLKLVNSPYFMFPKKVHGIMEAVKLLGLKGLKKQLYSYGTQKVLSTKMTTLWEHSYRVAFYAFNLAKNLRQKREFQENVYVSGVLHDMGKIVFSELHPHLLDQINHICKSKEVAREILEAFSAGLNHAEIGGMIAEKWEFPPVLIDAIRYHHEVDRAPANSKEVVETVYLGNALADCREGKIAFNQIDKNILLKFGIRDQEKFENILKRLELTFKENMDK